MELCGGNSDETGLNQSDQSALNVVITGMDINNIYVYSPQPIPIDSDADWNINPLREYNILTDDFQINSLSVVVINNNQENPICIDKVIINNQKGILNSFWIGSDAVTDRVCVPAVPAVLSWPICCIDIISSTETLKSTRI
eukprot:380906_1